MDLPEHRCAFGDRVRELRQETGWASQEDFAHHAEIDRTYVTASNVACGTRRWT